MGWNSTQRHGLRDEVYHVSIPNGIEFYGKAVNAGYVSFAFQFPLGIETMGDSRREKQATRHEERAFLCPLVNLIKNC